MLGNYSVSRYGDRLKTGEEILISHRVVYKDSPQELSILSKENVDTLTTLKESLEEQESEAFSKLIEATEEWEKLAAQTMLINKAIEYCRIPKTKHTANEWVKGEDTDCSISNMTYIMFFRINENTRYDIELEKSVPVSWDVMWHVRTNAPLHRAGYEHSNVKIDGQKGKHFMDTESLYKYIEGRKKAYAHLFTEISPPVPKKYCRPFLVNGLLLPDYVLEQDEPAPELLPEGDKKTSKRKESPEYGER